MQRAMQLSRDSNWMQIGTASHCIALHWYERAHIYAPVKSAQLDMNCKSRLSRTKKKILDKLTFFRPMHNNDDDDNDDDDNDNEDEVGADDSW